MPELSIEELESTNEIFYEQLENAVRQLFDSAKEKNELQFVMALNPEFRGAQDAGWNTAKEAMKAFDEYINFINNEEPTSITARVALGFYSHISEASGLYEVPKNMLRIIEDKPYVLWPFQDIVQVHARTGNVIAPNANKILRNLAGHAEELQLHDLAICFRDAFNSDLRNGYAHADYIIWEDGIRLRNRNGGNPKIISWIEFNKLLERGINFFNTFRDIALEYVQSYNPPKRITASLGGAPLSEWTIQFNPDTGSFSISG